LGGLKEITIRLSDNEYREYVQKGQSMYSKRMRRTVTETEYARWVFLIGEYFKSQSLDEGLDESAS
jgi:hypothetical protein